MRHSLSSAGLILLGASVSAQQASDTGLGFVDAQSAIAVQLGVEHDGLLGLAVDATGHYWVSARRATPQDPHRIFELNAQGIVLGSYAAPAETAGSIFGLRDGAYDAANDRIYWGIDPAGAPQHNVYAFDVRTRQFAPAHDILANVVTSTLRGLAFDGTRLWAADFASPITSFDRAGNQLSAIGSPSDSTYGLAWHPTHNTLWLATQTGLGDGSTQGGAFAPGVHVVEIDPMSGVPTGNRFRADHLLPFGTTGVSGGAEIWRRGNDHVISILVQGSPHDGIVELVVDVDVGVGCGGLRLGYDGGNAWAGNANFTITANGIEANASCTMLLGFDPSSAIVPSLTLCPILTNFVGAYTAPRIGAAHRLALPIPSGVLAIGLSFQAAELGSTLPFDMSQVLWLRIVP